MRKMAGSNRSTNGINDAYIKLVGAVLKDDSPMYYLCECANKWSAIAGIDTHILYEQARKGTEFESIPFQTLPHKRWHRLSINLKKLGFQEATRHLLN